MDQQGKELEKLRKDRNETQGMRIDETESRGYDGAMPGVETIWHRDALPQWEREMM